MDKEKDIVRLDISYIKGLIQKILDNNHIDQRKKHIKENSKELIFACPICGDSAKRPHEKRGHLYLKNMMYICYNERESCSRSFSRLLKTFDINMDINKKLELYQYLDQNVQFKKTDNVELSNLDKLFDIKDLMDFYKDDYKRGLTGLKPLQKDSPTNHYIRNIRNIRNTEDIYEGYYHFTEKWKQPVAVFLNRMGDKVISFQIRNLLDIKKKRYFKIFDFSYIYEQMNPNDILDEQDKISYDKLSHFFNLFNIDYTQTVNIFESYTDSLFLPNSIGQVGLNTDLSFLLNEDLQLRFIYDNDGPGFEKTEKMLKNGHNVFLWNKFFLDLIKKYKGDKKYMANLLSESIKDFNKLAIKFRKPIHNMFNWNEYFSNDIIDKIYLMELKDLIKMNL